MSVHQNGPELMFSSYDYLMFADIDHKHPDVIKDLK